MRDTLTVSDHLIIVFPNYVVKYLIVFARNGAAHLII